MSVDWNKPIQTRDGRKAEFLREINTSGDPMVGVVTNKDGSQMVLAWKRNGAYLKGIETGHDIINVPDPAPVGEEVVTMYAGVLQQGNGDYTLGRCLHRIATFATGHRDCVGVAEIRVRMRK